MKAGAKLGDVIGEYRVLARAGTSKRGIVWQCECTSCGNRRELDTNRLKFFPPLCCAGGDEGSEPGYAMSFAEIGKELGMSRQMVQIHYTRAIAKLRRALANRGIALEDLC